MFVRPIFKPDVKALFPTGSNQNICHVLSWQYMNTVMGNLIQELPEDEAEFKTWQDSFEYFVCSICLPDNIFEEYQILLACEIQNDKAYLYKYADAANTIRNNVQVTKQEIIKQVSSYYSADDLSQRNGINDDILKLSWELLEFLNSMPTNLKVGNASWNKSIGGAVDPRSWEFSTDGLEIKMLTDQGFRKVLVPTLDCVNAHSVSEEIADVDGLYCELTHPVDHIQLTCAFNIDPKFVVPNTYLYTGVYEVQGQGQGLALTVCSSSNPLMLINSDVNHQPIPVYVKIIENLESLEMINNLELFEWKRLY